MSLAVSLDRTQSTLDQQAADHRAWYDRIKAELDVAGRLIQADPQARQGWQLLVDQAAALVAEAAAGQRGIADAVAAAERVLAPVAAAAKQYTIHCTGHAHIDMNWLWNWAETVATVNDTFTTVDRLMDEFPEFHFSQSQASVYQIVKDYLPELHARIRKRVKQGRWEIIASQWVEGDKNLASGEIICRHLLYTRRFFRKEYGLPFDTVQIDWEPDTFGHANTLPALLRHGGVKYYYHHRAARGPRLYWWQGSDGSRLLAFDDRARGYNGQITPGIVNGLLEFEKETGLKDYLFVFGVGDHGGGPTRRDLDMAMKMNAWPVFPTVRLSTNQRFFDIAARDGKNLPVVEGELNYVFEGCYTAQSNIKRANRKSENALVEAEACALLGRGLVDMPYPSAALYDAWRNAMFNQFHDILPGSGVHATYEYAQGLYQRILADTTMIKTRALRAIAGRIDTAGLCACGVALPADGPRVGVGIGGGPGDIKADATVSRAGAGGVGCDPFVIFNPSPWARTELVAASLWDRDWPTDTQLMVTDDAGHQFPAQVVARDGYWGHSRIEVAFVAESVPALGYRTYSVTRSVDPGTARAGCTGNGINRMENEFYAVEVDRRSGALLHLVDKQSGIDLVPAGGRLGLLEYALESQHAMTAWVIGQVEKSQFLENGSVDCPLLGPYAASIRCQQTFKDSKFTFTVSLAAGVPRIDFALDVDWLERGSPEIGVPSLRVHFPLALVDTVATCETANGSVVRSTSVADFWSQSAVYSQANYRAPNHKIDTATGEVPAQKWADLSGTHPASGKACGATLVNDTKYGHCLVGNLLRLTLLRSSYDPDPLPELGRHQIRFALHPHTGACSPAAATRAGYAFNLPLNVVGTSEHAGDLPRTQGFAELLTPGVMLSGLKRAEDSDALIVRLYEMEGKAVTAQVKLAAVLAAPDAPAVETDAMEEPVARNTATLKRGLLRVKLPAFGQVTVKIG